MPTIKQLRDQIAKEKSKRKEIELKTSLELEKSSLSRELRILQRKPSTIRNIKILKRTGKGLKFISGKAFTVAKRQVKLIKEQQLRDEALARRDAKRLVKRVIITGKGKKKKKKIIFQKPNKVIKQPQQEDFFGGLPGLDF